MEYLQAFGIAMLAYIILMPVFRWWCDRSMHRSPPSGYTKEEWLLKIGKDPWGRKPPKLEEGIKENKNEVQKIYKKRNRAKN